MILRNKDGKNTYSRQNYIFNISIMVEKNRFFENRLIFQEICRKIVYFFTSLEVKNKEIFKKNKANCMVFIF